MTPAGARLAVRDADRGHAGFRGRTRHEDGVQIGSIEIAIRKAQTAVNFKRPSRAFADRLDKGATGLVALPGALPKILGK